MVLPVSLYSEHPAVVQIIIAVNYTTTPDLRIEQLHSLSAPLGLTPLSSCPEVCKLISPPLRVFVSSKQTKIVNDSSVDILDAPTILESSLELANEATSAIRTFCDSYGIGFQFSAPIQPYVVIKAKLSRAPTVSFCDKTDSGTQMVDDHGNVRVIARGDVLAARTLWDECMNRATSAM